MLIGMMLGLYGRKSFSGFKQKNKITIAKQSINSYQTDVSKDQSLFQQFKEIKFLEFV
jgi:hypothetical protein